jgi:hypothetical protein
MVDLPVIVRAAGSAAIIIAEIRIISSELGQQGSHRSGHGSSIGGLQG